VKLRQHSEREAEPAAISGHAAADPLHASPRQLAQRERIQSSFGPAAQLQAEPEPNRTGLPDHLKAGIESLSGMDLSDVRVHRNSDQPAQLNALAYAQGNDIHLGPGQEQHLPHEAWHVVQQAQGRVRPTMQMRGRVDVNDDEGLEREADQMGLRATQLRPDPAQVGRLPLMPISAAPVQRFRHNHANTNADVGFPFDTANEAEAVGIIRSLVSDGDDVQMLAIYDALKLHVQHGAVVTASDRKLYYWLQPIAVAARKLATARTDLANVTPGRVRTSLADWSKWFTVNGVVATGAVLSLDTLVNWMTTPPQTNVVFGSMSMSTQGANYTVHTSGMDLRVDMTDPENNRTLEGSVHIPSQQSQILGGNLASNITQNPLEVPTHTQNFHTFALVTSAALATGTILAGGVWWIAKPSQSTVDEMARLSGLVKDLWERIRTLTDLPPI
jgi:hypothetical protein